MRIPASNGGPNLWVVTRGQAKAYIFGFADATDRSWLTPSIEQAFRASGEVWFETPQADASAETDQGPSILVEQLGYDRERNLLEVLDLDLSTRLLVAATRYGLGRDSLVHTRAWLAYFVLNSAYRAHRDENGASSPLLDDNMPDAVLAEMARAAGKTIRSELATSDDALRYFAEMSDEVAAERLKMLLDFIDDDEADELVDEFEWISNPDSPALDRYIERMRRETPGLYQREHVQRNQEWAVRIEALLATGGTYFVAIGLNHTLGPDSLLRRLDERGIRTENV